jgi:ABC-type Fe3+ transport system permease subunit
MRRALQLATPAERAALGSLSSFALTIGIARAINIARERRRRFSSLRGVGRRAYRAPGGERVRIHHFIPGMVVSALAGAAAIFTRDDGLELLLSVPFGVGAGLTLDEGALLVDLDDAYWASEELVAAQGALAALGAIGIGVRIRRKAREGAPARNASAL